jgi:hypothetical protein
MELTKMRAKFRKELSFNGRLSWEATDGKCYRLAAGFDGSTPLRHTDGWIFAGPDTYTDVYGNIVNAKLVHIDFWFGCYVRSDDSYGFEIRSLTQDFGRRFYRGQLDVSRNGYLGLYSSPTPDDIGYSEASAPFWKFRGDPHERIEAGAKHKGITLIGPNNGMIKRLVEDNYAYLSETGGHDATFTLDITKVNVDRP